MKRMIFAVIGLVSMGLGTLGIVLPVLPTVPFYLLAVYCFARSSQKLHDWFVSTKLYHDHLESYVKKEGMRKGTKIRIIGMVTVLMVCGLYLMLRKSLYIPCAILAVVWIAHIIYFGFRVRTIKE
ncbi:MAG: YbaN family protein [Bulleidia sp.]